MTALVYSVHVQYTWISNDRANILVILVWGVCRTGVQHTQGRKLILNFNQLLHNTVVQCT